MERVLDIDNILDDPGFVVSSCDDEEEVAQISKARSKLSSRLATIFADSCTTSSTSILSEEVIDSGIKEEPGVALSATIFSSTVYLYVLQSDRYVSKGRVGVAVVRSETLFYLVFYDSKKEAILYVPLGDGKIQRIYRQEKYCIVVAALKTLAFVCFNDDDEAKLIALLMILCSIKSTVLEVGDTDEIVMGSSVSYDSTKFKFNGTAIEVVVQQPSKLCISPSSDSWTSCLFGLKRSARCFILLDERTALGIHIEEIKNNLRRRIEEISKMKLSEEEPLDPSGDVLTDIPNAEICEDENSLHNQKNTNKDTWERMNTTQRIPFFYTSHEKESEDSIHPSLSDSTGFRKSNDKQIGSSKVGSFDRKVKRHGHGEESDQIFTEYSSFHRIVGVEIDRLECRLQVALERMVNSCMNSIKNEMIQIKEKQELLLEKLEDLRNWDVGR